MHFDPLSIITVVIVGLGNIGSQLVPLLARSREIIRLVLVDPQVYEMANQQGQNIRATDAGLAKVEVMARLARAIRSGIDVVTFQCAVEDVPLGCLRGNVIVSCVDSRRGRQTLNCVAWRLGVPLVDGSVMAEGLLSRVAVYLPGAEQPCVECRWDVDDYNLLEPVYECAGDRARGGPATAAPAELGCLTAANQTMAVRRLIGGDTELAGSEMFVSSRHQTLSSAKFSRLLSCRFDHATLPVRPAGCGARSRLGSLIGRFRPRGLSVEGHSFVFEVACSRCADLLPCAPVLTRLLDIPVCGRCGGDRVAAGQSLREVLPLAGLRPSRLLAHFGLRDGDVLSLHDPAKLPLHERIFVELGVACD